MDPPNADGLGWFRPARQRCKLGAMAQPAGPVGTHPAPAGFHPRCPVPKHPSGRCAAWAPADGLPSCAVRAIKSHIGFAIWISSQLTPSKQKHTAVGIGQPGTYVLAHAALGPRAGICQLGVDIQSTICLLQHKPHTSTCMDVCSALSVSVKIC